MDNRLLLLAGGFIIGFVISFFYVNSTYQNQLTAGNNQAINKEEMPHDHPPVGAETANTAATSGSKTGPLEALGAPPQSDKPTASDKSTQKDSAEKKDAKTESNSAKASDAYKNIQALKDIPASQLMVVMQSFTEGLGVSCTHCHTSMDDLASDTKPAKQIARKMLTMTRDINKSYPTDGHVTCYTCHRGALKPAS